ncbi:D-tyrosyl-tRNA(Tyr) deacylase [Chloropicon primus]|uniref:D-aminoacyl-tRNA deacylase n=1 Tax=Chloropicon primus TaxID=1764295 RepID=A0A5B8N1K4_9CHLO|nr:D-tyrosyl-tRNA(Tyr) deacylase [Chloropicon primus]|eukprot:QDZ25720.1 D-tyrosyl-tRNA(Tyr) deacylase [Chloropicon primus]
MRAVIQRVLSASVEVNGSIVSSIDRGLVCLIGLGKGEENAEEATDYIAKKILNGRYFENEETGKPWDLSVTAKGYEVLLVSQFTLYGKFKGNSLTYHQAMPPTEAKRAYEEFCQLIKSRYEEEKVFDGEFGAMMKVSLVNDGPVTITVDSSVKN